MNPYTRFCTINKERLAKVAQALTWKGLYIPSWRAPVFPEADNDTFIEFLGVGNAINFCFTNFETGKKFNIAYPKGTILTGAFAMWGSLKRALDAGMPVLDPDFLGLLTRPYAKYIFLDAGTSLPMLDARIQILREIGCVLQTPLYGVPSFSELFRKADYRLFADGEGIVERLVHLFPSYRDIRRIRRGKVYFHKRAQLFAMMYHGRAVDSNGALTPLRDPENIGPIADYEVPKALRELGILVYSDDLAEHVDRGIVIDEGSDMEIGLRVQTVHAVSELLEQTNTLRRAGHKKLITMAELDYWLWQEGRKGTGRHHYTETTSY